MSCYINAPATKLLATHCACCGRLLVDSKSVECGVGPECRKKHGYGEAQHLPNWEKLLTVLLMPSPPESLTEAIAIQDAHRAANVLVYHIAAQQSGEYVEQYVEALAALGYVKLARRMVQRLNGIIVDQDGATLVVRGPYNPQLGIRWIPGAAYSRKRGIRFTAPAEYNKLVWEALKNAYRTGTLVAGSKGVRKLA